MNFTTALSDANYAVTMATGQAANATGQDIGNAAGVAPTPSALRIGTRNSTTGGSLDVTYASVAVLR